MSIPSLRQIQNIQASRRRANPVKYFVQDVGDSLVQGIKSIKPLSTAGDLLGNAAGSFGSYAPLAIGGSAALKSLGSKLGLGKKGGRKRKPGRPKKNGGKKGGKKTGGRKVAMAVLRRPIPIQVI